MTKTNNDFTNGPILMPLIKFVMPILGALILQSLYGAVDLLVVGKFGEAIDISAVSTGAQILSSFTHIITSLAMGTTILIGKFIGAKKDKDAADTITSSIVLFVIIGVISTMFLPLSSNFFADILNAPSEAYAKTISYIRICGYGSIFIVAYNLLGSIFRGMGDSKTPLLAVMIAAIFNIFGDLYFVRNLKMGAAGAALATVISQGLSVIICLLIIFKRKLNLNASIDFKNTSKNIILKIIKLGIPIAIQSFMVNISFMVILAIINNIGLTASAGVGTAEKVTSFIMLVPSSFSQALAAFVAQNIGANKKERADKALKYAMFVSFSIDVFIFYFTFFHGDLLCSIFTNDKQIYLAGHQYLKSYAIDVLLTSWMFCFIGYFNGCGETKFTMLQGMLCAFFIRIPVSIIMNHLYNGSLFHIGLATPCTTIVQIILCVSFFFYRKKNA